MNGFTLLQTATFKIPMVDLNLTTLDLQFLRECGIIADICADWRPESEGGKEEL